MSEPTPVTPRMREIAERVARCQDSEADKRRLIAHAPADLLYLLAKVGVALPEGVDDE